MHPHAIAFLRAVHIVSASLWVGGVTMNALFVVPSIMSTGPAGGQVMREIVQARKMPVFMNVVSALAILSGLWLYWWNSDGFGLAWITSKTGLAFTLGALLAIATAGVGGAVMAPAARGMGELGAAIAAAGGPPTPEQVAKMKALQGKLLRGTRIGAVLLVLAAALMAVARFL